MLLVTTVVPSLNLFSSKKKTWVYLVIYVIYTNWFYKVGALPEIDKGSVVTFNINILYPLHVMEHESKGANTAEGFF